VPQTFAFRSETGNPAFERASVHCDLPGATDVTLNVLDARGRVVRTLVDHTAFQAGRYRWEWDLRDALGARVAPGVYFHRLEAFGESRTVKTVVIH